MGKYAETQHGYTQVAEAVESALPSGAYKLKMDQNGSIYFSKFKLETDNLLALPDSKSKFLVDEIQTFWNKRELFAQFGFLHKRGFLLYGPAGGGKSSTINLVIKHVVGVLGGLVIYDANPKLTAVALKQLRTQEPDRPLVVVFEDIDTRMGDEESLLALLDGEQQIPGVVYLATTNYLDKVGERLKNRPSRFDRVELIHLPSAEAREFFLRNKFGNVITNMAEWITATEGFGIAQMKELAISVLVFDNPIVEEAKRILGLAQRRDSDAANTVEKKFNIHDLYFNKILYTPNSIYKDVSAEGEISSPEPAEYIDDEEVDEHYSDDNTKTEGTGT